jgi:DNA mismatch repair ATPase MutS
MDEVGRGTTVDDGLAIAFATVHHLNSIQCRTLFATHFHELADMLGHSEDNRGHGPFRDVGFFCTGVDEIDVSLTIRFPPPVLIIHPRTDTLPTLTD